MKILKPDNLALLFTPCMTGDICCISVAAMACFSLDKSLDDPLLTEQVMWQSVAVELGEGVALDMGLPKHRGEFLLYGSCHSPAEVTGMQVSVSVAGLSKTLNVSGDRYWNAAGIPSTPEPFTTKRVCWDNAFGGEGWEPNPAGMGIVPDKNGRIPVPPVQDPRHPVTSHNECPDPAGFNALNPFCPQRKQYLGLFDDKWLANRWPHYPNDTDPEYFNSAPQDQRLSGFFKGDEAIKIGNMHPAKHEIVSKLPGVRSRLFINRVVNGSETFSEISSRAETLWLFPGSDCGILLFRGSSRVADDTLDDVTHLMAEWEPLNAQPESLEFYNRKFLTTVSPAEAEMVEPLPVTAPPPPEPPSAPPPELPKPPPLSPEDEKLMAEMNKKIAEAEAKADAVFAGMGLTRAEALEKYLPKPKPAPEMSLAELEKTIDDIRRQSEASLKKMGMTMEDALQKYLPTRPPAADMRQQIRTLSDELLKLDTHLKKSGVNLQEAAARQMPHLDPGQFDINKIIAGLATLATELPSGAKAAEPPLEKPEPAPAKPVDVPGSAEETDERIRQGKNLAGMDLSGMDFSGRKLAGADFTGSVLAKVNFAGADLKGAVFADALLADANFSGAGMEQTRLTGVQAVGARFTAARLNGANLSGSDFAGCEFSRAVLTGAILTGASLAGAVLKNVNGSGLTAVKANFAGADMTGTDLSHSLLSAADFSNAILDKCSFRKAEASGAEFYGAKGTGTDFSGTVLAGSRGEKGTEFSGAFFTGADMSRSCWEWVALTGTLMDSAVLDHADFSRAVFDRVHMVNATARETKLLKAVMSRCDLRGVNFFKASMRQARLKECDMKSCSMFGVDLYGAKITNCDLHGADFRRAQTGFSGKQE